ncbi:MAG: fatty acid desaturase CarF family protein [Caulobacteraceae bacterium]
MKARLLLALFFVSLAFNASRIVGPLDWRMLLAALAAWWTADLLSGVVHMWMDYRPCVTGVGLKELYFWEGSRESPEFMVRQAEVYARINTFERICYDFKKHHPMPDLLGRHGVFHLMKAPTFFITLPLSLALNAAVLFWRPPGWAMVFAVTLLIGNSLTQYFHGTLHKVRSPWPIRLMRGLGLLMTPAAHEHHHATLREDFSVINGWSNPALNLLVGALRRAGMLDEAGLVPG